MTSKQIAIVGAGIGGLATAAFLARAGHAVRVYDQFEAPAPVGSGLVVQPVGRAVLSALGLELEAQAQGQLLTRIEGTSVETTGIVLAARYGDDAEHRGLGIHRAALFSLLLGAATDAGAELILAHPVVAAGGGAITFAGGATQPGFDLIIDASGAGSELSPIKARALPYGAIWANVDWVEGVLPADRLTQRYSHADRMMGVLPIGTPAGATGPKAALFWSLPAGGYDAWRAGGVAAWRETAAAHWPQAAPFAAQITDPDQFTMARYGHGTLWRPVRDGIVHIGDAAHRTSPQLGQGANMALLDAWALAHAMAQTSHLPDALRSFALSRRWHVAAYQLLSAAFTPQYQSDSRTLAFLRDRILFPISQIPPIPAALSALVRGTLVPPISGHRPENPTRT